MFITTHHMTDLTSQHVLQSSSDHPREDDKTVLSSPQGWSLTDWKTC